MAVLDTIANLSAIAEVAHYLEEVSHLVAHPVQALFALVASGDALGFVE